jgi:hypothetical protein
VCVCVLILHGVCVCVLCATKCINYMAYALNVCTGVEGLVFSFVSESDLTRHVMYASKWFRRAVDARWLYLETAYEQRFKAKVLPLFCVSTNEEVEIVRVKSRKKMKLEKEQKERKLLSQKDTQGDSTSGLTPSSSSSSSPPYSSSLPAADAKSSSSPSSDDEKVKPPKPETSQIEMYKDIDTACKYFFLISHAGDVQNSPFVRAPPPEDVSTYQIWNGLSADPTQGGILSPAVKCVWVVGDKLCVGCEDGYLNVYNLNEDVDRSEYVKVA